MDWSDPELPDYEIPKLSIQENCIEDVISFNVHGNFQYDSLLWETGDGTSSNSAVFEHSYQEPGTYEITFNWYLCGFKYSLKQEKEIGFSPVFSLGEDTIICHGTSLSLQGPTSANNYLWWNGHTTPSTSVNESGTYWLRAGNGNCYATDTIQVSVNPPILVELGEGHFLCEEKEELVILDAGKGFESYLWTPTADTTQWIIVKKTGDYFVVVEDFRGCKGDDGTTVERRCPVQIYLPNAFSPNGDGINDIFTPVFANVLNYELIIYNRWGEKVFVSREPVNGWDGISNNTVHPEGKYIYQLFFSGYDNNGNLNTYHLSGEVYLLK